MHSWEIILNGLAVSQREVYIDVNPQAEDTLLHLVLALVFTGRVSSEGWKPCPLIMRPELVESLLLGISS